MSNHIEDFVKGVKAYVAQENKTVSDDFVAAMQHVEGVVESWCNGLSLTTTKEVENSGYMVTVANESLKAAELSSVIGPEKIVELCKNANVANEHLEAAATLIAALMSRACGGKASATFRSYAAKGHALGKEVGLESLFPSAVISSFSRTLPLTAEAGEESFGINMDRVEPDLKTIIAVALLQFHTNLTPRIVPIQTATQGNVTLVREQMTIYDMSQQEQVPTRLLELYKDPSLVSTRAQRIEPRAANATAGELWVTGGEHGVYAVKKAINLFKLAIDPNRPGYEKFNHTDFVEDGIQVDGVVVKITKTTGEPGSAVTKTNYFLLPIPYSRGRLTQFTNDLASTDRRLNLDRFPIRLVADSAVLTTLPSGVNQDLVEGNKAAVLAGFTDGAQLALDLHFTAHVDRRIAMADADGWFGAFRVVNGDDKLAAGISGEVLGYTLDARYNEDNKRKTSIRAELIRNSMSYELPTGRNFVVDAAIGQEGQANASARLAQLEHIGRDYGNLKIIEEVLKSVHDQNVSLGNDKEGRKSLAAQYAAGDLVNPYVIVDTLDMGGMYGIRSADASGDVKGFLKMYCNKITSKILAESFYAQQLADGATITFRCITSNEILGNLFKAKQIHQHLDTDTAATGGVEYAIVLDNGVKLELVTTTFDSCRDMIYIIPYLTNAQGSVLNFGTDWDQGTLVGAVTIGTDGGASYFRQFSTTRELLIPTNVIGAVIQVVGCGRITPTDSNGELTLIQGAAKSTQFT